MDKKILSRQTYYSAKPGVEFEEHDIYTKFSNNFEHNVDLVFFRNGSSLLLSGL